MSKLPNLSRRSFLGSAAVALSMPMIGRAQAQGLKKINITSTQGLAGLCLQDLVVSQGFMKEQGLETEFLNVSDGAKTIAALAGGSADFCIWSGSGGVTPAIEKGGKLKLIAGALMYPTQAIFSSKPDIKKVADLKGKTIGVGALGAQIHQFMIAVLRKKGVDPNSVTFRNVGSSADIFRAVSAGTVDAGTAETDVYQNQAKYGVHSLDDGLLWVELSDFTFQAGYATDDAIAKKRDAIVHALAAFAKVYRYVQSPESKDAWVKAYAKVSGRTGSEEALSLWDFNQKFKPYAVDLELSPERVKYLQEFNVESQVQSKVLPFEQVADMSLAREAVKLVK
jgi:ABC-type nitrate/sulfonate/bicarbonate transport system substrate-binding protein